ncbi:MAG: CHAT domain-containing tetratricopeptide repeat protein, partial [Spirochaetia bacterium]
DALSRLGAHQLYKGDIASAKATLEDALARYPAMKTPDPELLADILEKRGSVAFSLGLYAESLDWNRQSMDVWKSLPTVPESKLVSIHNSFAATYLRMGRYDEAIDSLEKGIAATRMGNGGADNLQTAEMYSNMGVAFTNKGEYDKAVGLYEKSLDIDTSVLGPQSTLAADIYCNIGIIYHDEGKYDQAIEYYKKALDMDEKLRGPNSSDTAIDLNNIGEAYASKRDFAKAIPYYESAGKLWRANLGPANWMVGVNAANIGEACRNLGDFTRAQASYAQALAIYKSALGEGHPRVAEVHSYLAKLYEKAGDRKKALESARAAVDVIMRTLDRQRIVEYENAYGLLLLSGGDAAAARARFDEAIAVIEKARSETGSGKAEFLGRNVGSYLYSLRASADLGDLDSFFAAAERMKARGFLDELSLEAAASAEGVDPKDGKRIVELAQQLDELARNRSQEIGKPTAERNDAFVRDATNLIDSDEAEFAAIDARLMANERYRALRRPDLAELADARSLCDAKSGILEYIVWQEDDPESPAYKERRSYCLVIRKEGAKLVELDASYDYAASVNRFRQAIIEGNAKDREAEGALLYSKLFAPVAEAAKGLDRLVIVPDGALAFLPFDALKNGARCLCQDYELEMAPSVSVLQSMQKRKYGEDRQAFLAFGGADYGQGGSDTRGRSRGLSVTHVSAKSKQYYAQGSAESGLSGYYANLGLEWPNLPGTKEEVQALDRSIYGGRGSRVVTGSAVSEAAVKAMSASGELAKWRTLHFACHGYFDQDYPSLSAVVMSEAGSGAAKDGEDGYLSVQEVARLALRSDLVTLSACETGLGAVTKGDGVIGLTRAFAVAGANRVQVTLWQVDDAGTRDFMLAVYGKVVKSGKSFGAAISETKREFIASKDYADPWYWSPFVLYGN